MDEEHPAERNLQDDNSLPGSGTDVSLQPEPIQHENMEVHHHPDLKHKKKHWTEYFLEFLMIFLAVTASADQSFFSTPLIPSTAPCRG